MKKIFAACYRSPLLVAAFVVFSLALLFMSCGREKADVSNVNDKVPVTVFLTDCQSLATQVTATVIARDEQFIPHDVTIPVHGVVKWTNVGSETDHTDYWINSDTASFSTTTSMAPGQSICFQFDTAGTYNYHCLPEVTGTVIVR